MNSFQNETPPRAASPSALGQIPGWKRTLDVVLILLALPVVLPVMALVAGVVWMTSAGPVLFKQERVGYRGGRFMCFKFRTMRVGAETASHQWYLNQLMTSNAPMVKLDEQGDPRVVPFGSFLRSSGLDELPQLINVLRGEMSLVGPRPCLPYEYESYLPEQKERFNAAPGLTGLWQVSGKNRTTFAEMIRLDIAYAKRQSLGLDLWIMAKTIPALLIQMRETRRGRKSPMHSTVRSGVAVSARPVNQ